MKEQKPSAGGIGRLRKYTDPDEAPYATQKADVLTEEEAAIEKEIFQKRLAEYKVAQEKNRLAIAVEAARITEKNRASSKGLIDYIINNFDEPERGMLVTNVRLLLNQYL